MKQGKKIILTASKVPLCSNQSFDAPIISHLPFLSEVTVLKEGEKVQEIDGLIGTMTQVQTDQNAGFVFSGYLSDLPLPGFITERSYYRSGDLKKYVQALQDQGFSALYKQDNREIALLPINTVQEAFLIGKQLFPFLLKDKKLERRTLFEETIYHVKNPSHKPTWESFIPVYEILNLQKDRKINNWELYFVCNRTAGVTINLVQMGKIVQISYSEWK